MQSVTVPYGLFIVAAILLTALTLYTTALTIQQASVRRSVDLSRPSPHTRRTDCPRPGCTIVHPKTGRHRADPRPDSPLQIATATLITALLPRPQRGQHY